MALTEPGLRDAAPKGKPYKLFDGGGLHLLVNPNGSRIWRLAYRFAGKPKQLSFGPYPATSLADARRKRDDAKKLILNGQDPSLVRKMAKAATAEAAAGTAAEAVPDRFMKQLQEREKAHGTISENRFIFKEISGAGPAAAERRSQGEARAVGGESVTLRDVARAAMISVTTASHAINGTRYVSPESRDRIFAAIKQLGYTGNSIARSLRVGKTATIGLIVSDIDNPFFTQLASRVQVACAEHGYQVIFANTEKNVAREREILEALLAQRLDGVILAAPLARENVEWVIGRGVPLTIVNGDFGGLDAPQVLTDDVVSGQLGIDHLWELGHRRIAIVHGDLNRITTKARFVGVREALARRGVELDPALVAEATFPGESGDRNVLNLLAHPSSPTALFALSTWSTVVAIRALARSAMRFPEDISLVGMGVDSPYWVPAASVTMVEMPVEAMARAAVGVLLGHLESHREEAEFMVFLPSLVLRRSSAPAPDGAPKSVRMVRD